MSGIAESIGALALSWLVLAAPAADAQATVQAAGQAASPTRDAAAKALLEAAGVDGTARGRELFAQVLASELFGHEAVGPFDVYVARLDGQKKPADLKKTLGLAHEELLALQPVLEKRFPRQDGILSGQRFPIVLVDSDRANGQHGFDELVALLDRCEDEGWSGWKPWSPVWDPANLEADSIHTWEVLLVNLGHPSLADQGRRAWFGQPFGFTVLQALSRRLLAQGAWGTPVPWLAQGLVDELDIEAHGKAWVGADETGAAHSWSNTRSNKWTSTGWSGFLADGQQPPPPVVTHSSTTTSSSSTTQGFSELWGDRSASVTRHWRDLSGDRKAREPASFRTMAEKQSFETRDRALSRLAVHLLLDVLPSSRESLLAALDRKPVVPETLMRDSEPLPVLVARALGGVPAVDAFEALPMRQVLESAGRKELLDSITAQGGAGLLELADHRQQAAWLYWQPTIDTPSRRQLELEIQEAEYEQQKHEWVLVGEALDVAVNAALAASRTLPATDKERAKVADAMTAALDAFRAKAKAGG
ncbi:MAG TPA: hypothetical protein VK824_07835 [Planctomycetota bacterium]|nr:hypothetical protein [Planctomycetota bacterium]